MAKLQITHRNSTFKVCVNQMQDGLISGVVVGQRLREPMPFRDMNSLLLGMEYVMEMQNFPQAFQQSRTFTQRITTSPYGATEADEGMSDQAVSDATGVLKTFEVQVLSRASSTWQGKLFLPGQSEPEKFLSVLDLMYCIELLMQ